MSSFLRKGSEKMKKKILCLFFAGLLLISIFPLSIFADKTTADGSDGELVYTDLSETDIVYDFEYIFFNAYKIEDYKPNAFKDDIELITMTETRSKEGNVELYIYVYNPSQKTIFFNSDNSITLSIYQGTGEFEEYIKYNLEFVNYENATKKTDIETNASIIKYKVSKYSAAVADSSRSYGISEIEIPTKEDGLQSYTVGKSFNFTDGSDGLSTVKYGTFEVMGLDVCHTYYRVLTNLTNSTKEYKEVRSVYFAVNNEKVKNAGELDSLKISYGKYTTKPILIVDDEEVYDAFYETLGKGFDEGFKYSFGSGIKSDYRVALNPTLVSFISPLGILRAIAKGTCGYQDTTFNYVINSSDIPLRFIRGDRNFAENIQTMFDIQYSAYSRNVFNQDFYDKEIDKLYWLFQLDSYSELTGKKILEYVECYNAGDTSWSDDLFNYSYFYNNVEIKRTQLNETGDYYTFEQNVFEKVFSKLFGNLGTLENQENIEFNLLDKFATKDLDLTDEELSKKYLIDINDVGAFRTFVKENAHSTIYLLRYTVTDTVLEEGSMFSDSLIDIEALPAILQGYTGKNYCCTSTLAHTTLIKGFNIIELKYVNELGEYTVFPVGMTPSNHAPDLEHPNKPSGSVNLDNAAKVANAMGVSLLTALVIIAFIGLLVYIFFICFPYLSAFLSNWGGSNVQTNVNINLSDEIEKKKNEVKKDEEKTD